MAAALLKNRAKYDRHFTYLSWKRSLKHTIFNQSAPTGNSLRRLKHSDFRNPKHMEFPSPTTISARFSSSKPSFSSSSHKFRLVGWYLNSLNNRPIATKSITAALIYTAADTTSQTLVGEMEQFELVRTLRMAGYGLLILGPSLHYWYNLMSRFFPKRDLVSTVKKMALGQTLYGPAMTLVFFSVNAALQGESGSEIVARLKRDLIPTMINGVLYWPVCDFVTFKFIPVHLQPLVVNLFSYIWTVYMTYMASLAKVGQGNNKSAFLNLQMEASVYQTRSTKSIKVTVTISTSILII